MAIPQQAGSQPAVNGTQAFVPQLGHNILERAQPLTQRPLEELLTALRKGGNLWKHGRQGKPKVHLFHITDNDTRLTWMSKDNRNRSINIKDIKNLVHGQVTDVFARHPEPARAHLSFSLVYEDDSTVRTLDLTCPTQRDFEYWYCGIKALFEHLQTRTTGVPSASSFSRQIAQKAAAVAASRTGPLGSEFSAASGDLSLLRSSTGSAVPDSPVSQAGSAVAGRTASGSSALAGRIPGDCYVWGSAAAGPAVALGIPTPDWQHSLSPMLVDDSTHLDVRSVAVGHSHAGLLTHGGELYTWGSGNAARLGHGHGSAASTPQRVHTLWGAAATVVKCSDSASAAVLQDGCLYTWGDGAAGHLGYGHPSRQYIPRPVGGPLAQHVVAQVSCGPYHMAAVTADGRLFTWGDGFAGKLGHGNAESASAPRPVAALADFQVLGVACGAWHTAAVAWQPGQHNTGHLPIEPGGSPSSGTVASSCGALLTWGGNFSGKGNSHRGALGTGDEAGRMLPTRVAGQLSALPVRQVAAGTTFTVALTATGRVFQMGETGAKGGSVPWEGTLTPEMVGGPLTSYAVERVSAGSHHACVLAAPGDHRVQPTASLPQGQPARGAAGRVVLAWGCGSRGQLGSGKPADSVMPRIVEGNLRGRQILQVACGGDRTLAVCQHEVRDAGARGAADRRLLGSWSKRWDTLTVDVSQGSGYDPLGGQPSGGLAPLGSAMSLSASVASLAKESSKSQGPSGFRANSRARSAQLPPVLPDAARRGAPKPAGRWPFARTPQASTATGTAQDTGSSERRKPPRRHTSMDAGPGVSGNNGRKQAASRRSAFSSALGFSGRRTSEPDNSLGRLSSGDLPRLATAPSVASSTGDSSQHGSVQQGSGAMRGPEAVQDGQRQQQYIDHLEGEVARLQQLLQVAQMQQHRQGDTSSAQSSRPPSSGTAADRPEVTSGLLGNGMPADGHVNRDSWSTSAADGSDGSRAMQPQQRQLTDKDPQPALLNGGALAAPQTSKNSHTDSISAATTLGPGVLPHGYPAGRRLNSRSRSAEELRLPDEDDSSSLPEVPPPLLSIRAEAEIPAGYVSDGAADRAQRRRDTDDSDFSLSHSRCATASSLLVTSPAPMEALSAAQHHGQPHRIPDSRAPDASDAHVQPDVLGGSGSVTVGPMPEAAEHRASRRGRGFHSRTASLFGEDLTIADVAVTRAPANLPATPAAATAHQSRDIPEPAVVDELAAATVPTQTLDTLRSIRTSSFSFPDPPTSAFGQQDSPFAAYPEAAAQGTVQRRGSEDTAAQQQDAGSLSGGSGGSSGGKHFRRKSRSRLELPPWQT